MRIANTLLPAALSVMTSIGCGPAAVESNRSDDSNRAVNVNGNANPLKTTVEKNADPEFSKSQKAKALEPRNAPVGMNPKGLEVAPELASNGVIKPKAKLAEMVAGGYRLPMDFSDLAEKLQNGELAELAEATKDYVFADIGASEDPFTSFTFEGGSVALASDSPKYRTLEKLASDFGGTKYDLTKSQDRKAVRTRLLRLVNPETKKTVEEVAAAYQKQFARPLLLGAATYSMDYQIDLNKVSATSFKVMGKDSLPPRLSGCVFFIERKHLTAEEQNFIIGKLAELERNEKLDALVIYGDQVGFYSFVYSDGRPPKVDPESE
ncbi:MAG: hypothetical protein IPN69_01520 [Acidobacteria bacterium]|nr:hypothetical protein [Acidobacteriota bacterium]